MTDSDQPGDKSGDEEATELRFVGPSTAEAVADASFEISDIRRKSVSYEMLIEAGVNAGVAGKIRREHSLPWSLGGSDGDGLSRRSSQVRGLRDEERAWVAASTGDWETMDTDAAEADGSGAAEAAEAAWRDRSQPDPVTDLDVIDEKTSEKLADAGITSVRSLSTANPESVADVLGLDEETVREWRDVARDAL